MKTIEQIKKIKAVVLYVLNNMPKGVDYIKLSKLLYFAQRESLKSYGKTIFDDTFKAKDRGPVPTLTYKVLKMIENGDKFDECGELKEFGESIKVVKQKATALQKCNTDLLTIIDMKILDDTINKYGKINSKELSEMTHDKVYNSIIEKMKDDPEKDIFTLIYIARSGGASEDMIEYIRNKQVLKKALA